MPAKLSVARRRAVFDLLRADHNGMQAAAAAGVSKSQVYRMLGEVGGVIPRQPALSARFLCRDERYELARLRDAGASMRQIGRCLGRDPGTISREIARNSDPRTHRYQPERAETVARARQRRPKLRKLQRCARLRAWVQDRLDNDESPEQIAGRLVVQFPDDPLMRISHEAIYQALYLHPRGGLNRELRRHLRTGRSTRKPRRTRETRGQITDLVSIHERPAEIEDRLIPGHHEGDLIMGSTESNSAIGTIVERSSGYLMLVHLPHGHTADNLVPALSATVEQLPKNLCKTITWDRGREMAGHTRITTATGIKIYFADPYAPWQRGSNENINGLLRQYFPKGTDLSVHPATELQRVADLLNNRPRKRLGFLTPNEVIHKIIDEDQQPSVATIT